MTKGHHIMVLQLQHVLIPAYTIEIDLASDVHHDVDVPPERTKTFFTLSSY